jgi:hypothetical protein
VRTSGAEVRRAEVQRAEHGLGAAHILPRGGAAGLRSALGTGKLGDNLIAGWGSTLRVCMLAHSLLLKALQRV